jgi:hypothetical protein
LEKGIKENISKRHYDYTKPRPVYSLSYLAHLVLKDRAQKNLLLVYFPLHFTIYPSKKIEFTAKQTVSSMNSQSKDAIVFNDIYRIPTILLAFLTNYVLLLNFQTYRDEYYYERNESEVIKFGLMEVSVATCCAFDLRSAVVVLYQKLVSSDTIQIVNVENLAINCDKFFSLHSDLRQVCEYLDDEVAKFSKNVIFISDMDGDLTIESNALAELRKNEWENSSLVDEGTLADNILKNMKNHSLANVWFAKDLDVYYGAKKYGSSGSLFPYTLKSCDRYFA